MNVRDQLPEVLKAAKTLENELVHNSTSNCGRCGGLSITPAQRRTLQTLTRHVINGIGQTIDLATGVEEAVIRETVALLGTPQGAHLGYEQAKAQIEERRSLQPAGASQ